MHCLPSAFINSLLGWVTVLGCSFLWKSQFLVYVCVLSGPKSAFPPLVGDTKRTSQPFLWLKELVVVQVKSWTFFTVMEGQLFCTVVPDCRFWSFLFKFPSLNRVMETASTSLLTRVLWIIFVEIYFPFGVCSMLYLSYYPICCPVSFWPWEYNHLEISFQIFSYMWMYTHTRTLKITKQYCLVYFFHWMMLWTSFQVSVKEDIELFTSTLVCIFAFV